LDIYYKINENKFLQTNVDALSKKCRLLVRILVRYFRVYSFPRVIKLKLKLVVDGDVSSMSDAVGRRITIRNKLPPKIFKPWPT
jgi:hypothetical protein